MAYVLQELPVFVPSKPWLTLLQTKTWMLFKMDVIESKLEMSAIWLRFMVMFSTPQAKHWPAEDVLNVQCLTVH